MFKGIFGRIVGGVEGEGKGKGKEVVSFYSKENVGGEVCGGGLG